MRKGQKSAVASSASGSAGGKNGCKNQKNPNENRHAASKPPAIQQNNQRRMDRNNHRMRINQENSHRRGVAEMIQKLDEMQSDTQSIPALFKPRIMELRTQIMEKCLSVILSDVSDAGRKAEDYVWRKVFHSLMQIYKNQRDRATRLDMGLLECHYRMGIGFYYNLIISLASAKGIDISVILMEGCGDPLFQDETRPTTEIRSPEEVLKIRQVIHRCLVYMGDMSRYLEELAQTNSDRQLAIYWYEKAIIWDPRIGMPQNQLGTLMASVNYGLDSAYHYMRCIFSAKPFDGAEENLKRILRSKTSDEDMETWNNNQLTESQISVKRCIRNFLTLCGNIWFSDETSAKSVDTSDGVPQRVIGWLNQLKDSLKIEPKVTSLKKPSYLDQNIIFKMGMVILMIGNKCTKHPVEEIRSASMALSINLHRVLMSAGIDGDHLAAGAAGSAGIVRLGLDDIISSQSSSSGGGRCGGSETPPEGSSESPRHTPVRSKRSQLKEPRKRNKQIFDDIDTNFDYLDEDDEDDSDLSDLENTALRAINVLDMTASDDQEEDASDYDDEDDDDD